MIYRAFADRYGWPAEVVDNLTPNQMLVYLADRDGLVRFQSADEAIAYLKDREDACKSGR